MRENHPDFAKILAGRFETTLSKFKGYYYFHIKDNKEQVDKNGAKKPQRRISLNAEALIALSSVLPDILKVVGGSSSRGRSKSPPHKKRRKVIPEETYGEDTESESDYEEEDLVTSFKRK